MAAATLPVISNILDNSLASLAITARLPEPAAIASSEKGTLPANVFNTLNAFAPSVAELNNSLNLTCNDSVS